jgi:hypothetical protein
MRILASITAALLFTFMLASTPAFTQEGQPDHAQDQSKDKDKDKNNKDTKDNNKDIKDKNNGEKRNDNGRQEEARPEARENAHPENAKPETARPQEQTRPEDQTRPEERRNHNMGRQDQTQPEERGGGGQRVANGGRGQRIPDDKFRASFGREHHFRVQRAQIVNQAQPQFVYGGYTFVLQQPWPSEWSYDDDCYIDYVDGDYYMYDLNHPGIQILVFVIG